MSTPAPLPHDAVAARARQLWQIANSPSGRDREFWLAAETELRLEHAQTKTAAKSRRRRA